MAPVNLPKILDADRRPPKTCNRKRSPPPGAPRKQTLQESIKLLRLRFSDPSKPSNYSAMLANSSTESLGLLLPKDQNMSPTTFEIPPRSNLQDKQTRKAKENNSEANITADSTPQWLWSTYQCRNWLGCVLTQYLSYTNDEANERIMKLGGFGPNLYLRTYEEWVELLEDEEVARGVYALVVARRYEEGGVPMGMKIGHGEEDAGKARVRNEGRNWMAWILRKKVRYG